MKIYHGWSNTFTGSFIQSSFFIVKNTRLHSHFIESGFEERENSNRKQAVYPVSDWISDTRLKSCVRTYTLTSLLSHIIGFEPRSVATWAQAVIAALTIWLDFIHKSG